MALTDVAVRQAKPREKQYKLADGQGLYLLVTPAGGKLCRLKYRVAGKEKLMAFGAYPEVSLADARKRRDEAHEQIAASNDPSGEKPRAKVRAEYCAKQKPDGAGAVVQFSGQAQRIPLFQLNADFGSIPIVEIEPAYVLATVGKIEGNGTMSRF